MGRLRWTVTQILHFDNLSTAEILGREIDSENCCAVSYVDLVITPSASDIEFRKATVFIVLPENATGIESSFFNGLQLEVTHVKVYHGEDLWIKFYQQGRKKIVY